MKRVNGAKSKKIRFMCLILMVTIFLTCLSFAEDSYNISPKPEALRGDGEGLVWMSYANHNWDIFYMSTKEGVVKQITNDPNTQGYPDIWQNYIVWQDNRSSVDGGFNIYLYDIATKVEKKISVSSGSHQNPLVANNQVVWINEIGEKRVVMAYDISSGSTRVISSNDAKAYGLEFDGQTVVWMDARDEVFNIFMASLGTGIEKQVTFGLQDAIDPLVSDEKVIWRINHNGVDHVYMYEEATNYASRLTTGTEDHKPLAFVGDSMILVKGTELVLSNVSTIVETPIVTFTGNIPTQALLVGDSITWIDGGNIVTESVNNALDRALLKDETYTPAPTPTPTNPSTETTPEIQETEGRKFIKAGEERIISFDKGRATLHIPKGAFKDDTYLNFFIEEKSLNENYIPITDTYRWEFEGDAPLLPIQVTIAYHKEAIKDNPKKICGYEMSDEQPRIINTRRNYEEGTFSFTIKKNASVALMIFNKNFHDMTNHWSKDAVEVITSQQMISGYDDGSFRPNRNMTRAEFIKVLVNGLFVELQGENPQSFKDVPVDFWGAPYINVAKEKGWIVGHEGKFNPNSTITRQEMIAILMRVYEDMATTEYSYKGIDLSSYRDYEKISGWALDSMEKDVEIGIIQGSDNLLNPTGNATRAEATTILYRYLEKLDRL